MHVIMCKVLAYLYACMKSGVDADEKSIRHDSEMLGINIRYWSHIMAMLCDNGSSLASITSECMAMT